MALTIDGVRREFAVTRPPSTAGNGKPMLVVLRPDALELLAPETSGAWLGEVLTRRFAGGTSVYRVKMAGDITMEVESSKMKVREGDRVGVGISREPLPLVEAE